MAGLKLSRLSAALCMLVGGGLACAGKLAGLDLLIGAGFLVSFLIFLADRGLRAVRG